MAGRGTHCCSIVMNTQGRVLVLLAWLMVLLTACGSGPADWPGTTAKGQSAVPSAAASGDASGAASPQPSGTPTASGPLTLCTTSAVPFPRRVVSAGSYSIEPDQWNASGRICLNTSGDTGFTITTVDSMKPRSVGTPGAYPNVATTSGAAGLPVPVNALGDATVDWNASTNGVSGSYDLAFDLWYGPSADNCDSAASAEVMVWLDSTDNVQPAGSRVGDVTLDGSGYQVHQAPKSVPHTVISYVRQQPTHSVHQLDLRLFTQDAEVRGYVPAKSYLCKVSAGFEIWSGGVGLRSWSFGFDNAVGLPSGELASSSGDTCLLAPTEQSLGVQPVRGTCADGATARWLLGNDGTVSVNGDCLQGGGSSGSAVTLASCVGGQDQSWTPGTSGQLVNGGSGLCLGTAGSAATSGAGAVLQPCRGDAAQSWRTPYNGLR